ncbi:hypothetical protein [Herbaspirillum sp. ST 5-3]|uniref:hypothetical protein n=1 Tax=Oxalobacteraceae TaxID=75682 RepID=UPI0010A2E947|nr:hypothetical protein [Herbaspirillum sp. ST 5-3]
MKKETSPTRIRELRKSIDGLDRYFGAKNYSEKQVRDMLEAAKILVENGELCFETNGEVKKYPELASNIDDVIWAYIRGVQKVRLTRSEKKLNNEILKGLLLAGAEDE